MCATCIGSYQSTCRPESWLVGSYLEIWCQVDIGNRRWLECDLPATCSLVTFRLFALCSASPCQIVSVQSSWCCVNSSVCKHLIIWRWLELLTRDNVSDNQGYNANTTDVQSTSAIVRHEDPRPWADSVKQFGQCEPWIEKMMDAYVSYALDLKHVLLRLTILLDGTHVLC